MSEDTGSDRSRQQPHSVDDQIRLRKAILKIRITYWAVGTLLSTASLKLVWFLMVEKYDDAKDIFHIITPIASASIGYWYGRKITGE